MDEQIREILAAPDGGSARDALEMTVAAGGRIEIAGRQFPAPAAAVIAILELIGSPFVADTETEMTDLDVFRALYLIAEREKALPPVLRWQRRSEALETLKNQIADTASPQSVMVIAEMMQRIADAQAEFDAEALRYGESLGVFSVASAASELGVYLSLSGGFAMLPAKEGAKKKDGSTSTI